jgi:bifunctional DNase/RNase
MIHQLSWVEPTRPVNFHWLLEILEVLSLFISRWRIASLIRDTMVQAFVYPGGRGMSRHEDALKG